VLRKIAQAGLSGLSAMISGTAPPDAAPAPAPDKRGPAIASAEGLPPAVGESSLGALGYTAR
jgi:hypothetical protein